MEARHIMLAGLLALNAGCAAGPGTIVAEDSHDSPQASITYSVLSSLDTTSSNPLVPSLHVEHVFLRAYDASQCPEKKHIVLRGTLTHDVHELTAQIPAGKPVQIGMRYAKTDLGTQTCTAVVEFTPEAGRAYTAQFEFPIRTPDSDVDQCALRITALAPNSAPAGAVGTRVEVQKRDEAYCPIDRDVLSKMNYPRDNFY